MKKVIIESPYRGNSELNTKYARACMRDALKRGEAPFASHLLYTQPGILDDDVFEERELGIQAGFEWAKLANLTAVYMDLGISDGMEKGIKNAVETGQPIEFRKLGVKWEI